MQWYEVSLRLERIRTLEVAPQSKYMHIAKGLYVMNTCPFHLLNGRAARGALWVVCSKNHMLDAWQARDIPSAGSGDLSWALRENSRRTHIVWTSDRQLSIFCLLRIRFCMISSSCVQIRTTPLCRLFFKLHRRMIGPFRWRALQYKYVSFLFRATLYPG